MPRYAVRHVERWSSEADDVLILAGGAGAAAAPHPDCVARGGSGGWEIEGGGHAATCGTDHYFAAHCRSLIVINCAPKPK